ncbi:MAG: hypothetical protein SynsKO_43330 [Synoicihabitans sp.]
MASTTPELLAARVVDLTVASASVLVNSSEIFRRPSSSSIIIFVVFS